MIPALLAVGAVYLISKAISNSNKEKEQRKSNLVYDCSYEQRSIITQREQTKQESQRRQNVHFKKEQEKRLRHINDKQRHYAKLQPEVKKLPKDAQKRVNKQIQNNREMLSNHKKRVLGCSNLEQLKSVGSPKPLMINLNK